MAELALGPLASRKTLGDLVLTQFHPMFCLESGTIANLSATLATVELTDPMGYPLKTDGAGGFAFADSGDEASVIGLLLTDEIVPAVAAGGSARTKKSYPILARGPAVVNEAKIATNDAFDAAAFTLATIKTALLAKDILTRAEPTKTSTQTS